MRMMLFDIGKVPPTVEISGVHFKVVSKTLRPYFSDKKTAESVDSVECPVCQKKLWLMGIMNHMANQTRNSDSGHAKLYLKMSDSRGPVSSARAMVNIRKWKERHQHGLAMLERIEQMEGNNGASM